MPLTPKQARFVDEYLIDLNATQAAIRAGYSVDTAQRIGSENLSKPLVAAAVAERQSAVAQATEITQHRVINEYAAMAFYDPAEIGMADISCPKDIAKLPESVRRAIIGWSWDKAGNFVLKLSPKTPALDALGKHLGLFKNEVDVNLRLSIEELVRRSYKRVEAEKPAIDVEAVDE